MKRSRWGRWLEPTSWYFALSRPLKIMLNLLDGPELTLKNMIFLLLHGYVSNDCTRCYQIRHLGSPILYFTIFPGSQKMMKIDGKSIQYHDGM